MPKYGYDFLDVRIVDGLSKYTPRKIHQISLVLKESESTVRHRIHRLQRLKFMTMSINPRYENYGLIPAIVRFKYNPKYTEELIEKLGRNPYALCIQRIYGTISEIFVFYAVPLDKRKYFLYYLDRVADSEFADDYHIDWIISHQRVHHSAEWYDPETKKWIIDIEKLYNRYIKALDAVGKVERYELEEKVVCRIQDHYDIILLSAMEDEGDISLTKVAQRIKTTVQNLHYHFHTHILKHDLIESYIIHFDKFRDYPVLYPVFYIEFGRDEYKEAFSQATKGLTYLEFNSYVYGIKRLIQTTTMPIHIFKEYVKLLDRLTGEGYITSYSHFFMDNNVVECKKKLPYQLFRDDTWLFDEDKYLEVFLTGK